MLGRHIPEPRISQDLGHDSQRSPFQLVLAFGTALVQIYIPQLTDHPRPCGMAMAKSLHSFNHITCVTFAM